MQKYGSTHGMLCSMHFYVLLDNMGFSGYRCIPAQVIRSAARGPTVTARNMAPPIVSNAGDGRSLAIETPCVALATTAATVCLPVLSWVKSSGSSLHGCCLISADS